MDYFYYIMAALAVIMLIFLALGIRCELKAGKALKELKGNYGLQKFDEPVFNRQLAEAIKLRIVQVLLEDTALVDTIDFNENEGLHTGLVVYLHHEPQTPYYDDQVVSIPQGKHLEQTGIYKYVGVNNAVHTVPAVELF